jgi:hypothetical protein
MSNHTIKHHAGEEPPLIKKQRAKHIGTTDRMARLLDETFEKLVMARYKIVRHGGVEAIEVSKLSIRIL